MSKGVKQVRQKIKQRKKLRGLDSIETSTKQILPTFPQEEEKHGYFPSFLDNTLKKGNKSKLFSSFMVKGTLSVLLFTGIALLFETNSAIYNKPKSWTSHFLTEEFPFARMNQWYQETFGAPLAFSPKDNQVTAGGESLALPVIGNVTESFQANGTGIMIAPKETGPVSALRDGVIIFSGNDHETNKTIIIQHPDGSKSTYGFLSSVDVHLYQFVTANQRVGAFQPTDENETVYFSIEKNKQYIDPIQVIQVDDLS